MEFDINDAVALEAVKMFRPDLIVAPFLKRAIPAAIWRRHICLIVHPGPPGDRGPTALDWAILEGGRDWGVTVLQATGEMDAGPVWAHRRMTLHGATKSSLYRQEVTEAATAAVLEAVAKAEAGGFAPRTTVRSCWRDGVRQADRAIDWQRDDTTSVLRRIASGDGMPGVRDCLFGQPVFLFDAHAAEGLERAEPGSVVARSGPAIARATSDGAVWIGHVKKPDGIKLPATEVFAAETVDLPERAGYRDLWYEEEGAVGYLHFAFYNGAMGTEACRRLLAAYNQALARPTRVIVLMGGPDFWSNGLDLNRIEAADSAADESWANINAIDDLAEAIVRTTSHRVIAALSGNAGAGGVFLARAADEVWLRQGVILNPHYKDMGNLYGSELWTYLLPRHAGPENARRITEARLPMGAAQALSVGLAERAFAGTPGEFAVRVKEEAARLSAAAHLPALFDAKAERRCRDEAEKPLHRYRAEELERMRRNFYGFDPSYHVARYNFVYKVPKSRTPVTLARHRDARRRATPPRRTAS